MSAVALSENENVEDISIDRFFHGHHEQKVHYPNAKKGCKIKIRVVQ